MSSQLALIQDFLKFLVLQFELVMDEADQDSDYGSLTLGLMKKMKRKYLIASI